MRRRKADERFQVSAQPLAAEAASLIEKETPAFRVSSECKKANIESRQGVKY
jgi:hypothetical protein